MKVALSNTNFPFVSTQFNIRSAPLQSSLHGRPARGQLFLSCVFLFFVVVFFFLFNLFAFSSVVNMGSYGYEIFFFQFFTSWVILITQ